MGNNIATGSWCCTDSETKRMYEISGVKQIRIESVSILDKSSIIGDLYVDYDFITINSVKRAFSCLTV